LADNQTNQIVIGHQVTGLGSNTTVLGTSNTTFGRWFGRLLLGSSTDSGEMLQVTGTSKLAGNTAITGTLNVSSTMSVSSTINGLTIGTGAGSGTLNLAIGGGLASNVSGSENTAVGANALLSTTGSSNTGFGRAALINNTSGSNNTAIGYFAGRFIADGATSNTLSDNSIFIGYNTKPLAISQFNQIVIGHNVSGLGSNTNVFGNSSSVQTHLYGTLTVGTGTTPAASAIADFQSTTKGFLAPRVTSTQRNAISSPAAGLQVYDTDLNRLMIYNGTVWGSVGAMGGSYSTTGSATTSFVVTIGTTMPNTTYRVPVTPTSSVAAGNFFVTNKTTTAFTVTYTTALTGSVAFDWSVFR
jgi:hypothetical protein